jgi:hypothetical protein
LGESFLSCVSADKATLDAVGQKAVGILLGCLYHRIQREFRMGWQLIGIVNTAECGDLSPPSLGIHAFRIALFTYLQRGVDKDFNEVFLPDHVLDLITRHHIGADRGTDRHPAVTYDLGGNEAYAPDVGVTILFAEA